ncbi:MAG TPA: hypothetical protein VG755_19085 [Nannocystaceae bacterium]|nr:hypothetical protein [Nannocystaceae bacterium]
MTCLLCSPLVAGCLITTNSDDDDGNSSADTGNSSVETSFSSFSDTQQVDTSSGVDESGTESVGETTVGPMGDCSETRIVDGGFEAGAGAMIWDEASEQFGTPICDAGCTEDEGAEPYAGDFFAWYGGVAEEEHASVSQDVMFEGDNAYLSFRFEINAGAGTGDDVFSVLIGDETVFMATDLEVDDYASYTLVSLDVSDFVAGGEQSVEFRSDHLGTGLSNFFLDEVVLVTCTTGGASSSSSGSDTTAADSSSGSGSSDSSGSGSSDSGSSDSGSSSTSM